MPAETTLEQPKPYSASCSQKTVDTLPLWLTIPIAPGSGLRTGIHGKRPSLGTAIPWPLGPTSTMPPALARETISFWRARPSSPSSANPAVMTTPAGTPLRAASEIASGTRRAGMVKTARSTSPGMSDTLG